MSLTWILRLYPVAWRERYEAEMLALLEQYTVTPLTVFDLLLGALHAHLDPYYRTQGIPSPTHRLRLTAIVFICLFPVFLLTVLLWAIWVTDPSGMLYAIFVDVENTNSVVAFSNTIVTSSTILLWLTVLISGLLLAAATMRSALSTRRKGLFLSASLLGLLILLSPFLLAFSLMLTPDHPASTFFLFIILGLLGSLMSLLLALLAITKGTIGRQLARLMLIPATIATLAMTAILSATIVCVISIWTDIFQSYAIPFSAFTQWLAGWTMNFCFMTFPTIIALFVLIRGMLALSSPHTTASPPLQTPLQEQQ